MDFWSYLVFSPNSNFGSERPEEFTMSESATDSVEHPGDLENGDHETRLRSLKVWRKEIMNKVEQNSHSFRKYNLVALNFRIRIRLFARLVKL